MSSTECAYVATRFGCRAKNGGGSDCTLHSLHNSPSAMIVANHAVQITNNTMPLRTISMEIRLWLPKSVAQATARKRLCVEVINRELRCAPCFRPLHRITALAVSHRLPFVHCPIAPSCFLICSAHMPRVDVRAIYLSACSAIGLLANWTFLSGPMCPSGILASHCQVAVFSAMLCH